MFKMEVRGRDKERVDVLRPLIRHYYIRETDRQTERQADRECETETDRQTERQRQRDRETDRHRVNTSAPETLMKESQRKVEQQQQQNCSSNAPRVMCLSH